MHFFFLCEISNDTLNLGRRKYQIKSLVNLYSKAHVKEFKNLKIIEKISVTCFKKNHISFKTNRSC